MGMWLGVAALLVALAALGAVWKLNGEMGTARRRLDRYNKALFDAGDRIRELEERLAARTAELRVEMRRQSGEAAFTGETTMREAGLLHPQAEEVLSAFHLGGCQSCAVEPEASLARACAEKGAPLPRLLEALNSLPAGKNGAHERVKLPNVEFDL